MSFDELITEYTKRVRNGLSYNDGALLNMFILYGEDMAGFWDRYYAKSEEWVGYNFHKMFRQMPIIEIDPTGKLDMVVWYLLQDAPIFWKLVEEVTKEEKND